MLSIIQNQKLLHLFRIIDVDGNGFVERDDFESMIRRIAALRGWSEGDPSMTALRERVLRQWAAILAAEDPPGSGRVTPEGWLALWNALLMASYEDRIQGVTELLWETMDRDGNGRITEAESRPWFEFYGVGKAAAAQAFAACDLNGDGVISRDEWLVLVDEFFLSIDPKAPGTQLFGPLQEA